MFSLLFECCCTHALTVDRASFPHVYKCMCAHARAHTHRAIYLPIIYHRSISLPLSSIKINEHTDFSNSMFVSTSLFRQGVTSLLLFSVCLLIWLVSQYVSKRWHCVWTPCSMYLGSCWDSATPPPLSKHLTLLELWHPTTSHIYRANSLLINSSLENAWKPPSSNWLDTNTPLLNLYP